MTLGVEAVTVGGGPAVGVPVRVAPCDDSVFVGSGVTGENGLAELRDVPLGCLEVSVLAPWYSAGTLRHTFDADRRVVRLVVDQECPGPYRVVAGGEPVPEVTVEGSDIQRNGMVSGFDGQVSVLHRLCGVRNLVLTAGDGGPAASVTVHVAAPESVVDVALPALNYAFVRVVDSRGLPVKVDPIPGRFATWVPVDGGQYRVQARAGRVLLKARRTETGQLLRATIPLDKLAWTIVLDDELPREVRVDVLCEATDCPTQLLADGQACSGAGPYACTCTGECAIQAFRMVAPAPMAVWTEVAKVQATETRIEVDLRPKARALVTGTWGGTPSCSVRVDGPVTGLRMPCIDGLTVNLELEAGEWSLLVESPSGEAAAYSLWLEPGQNMDLGLIQPEPDVIHGTVLLPTGVTDVSLSLTPLASISLADDGGVTIRGLPIGHLVNLSLLADGGLYQTSFRIEDGFRWEVDMDSGVPGEGVTEVRAAE